MESPAVDDTRTDPFIQQPNSVHYVPPLRIVAPPGVPPFLPPSFDPFDFFKGFHHDRNGVARKKKASPSAAAVESKTALRKDFVVDAANGTKSGRFSTINAKLGTKSTKNTAYEDGGKATSSALGASSGNTETSILDHAEKRSEFVRISPMRADYGSSGAEGAESVADMAGGLKMGALMDHKLEYSEKLSKADFLSEISSEKKRKRVSKPRKRTSARASMEGISSSLSPYKSVTNTLRLYDALRRNLLLEEESKDKDANKGSRPDLQAGSLINNKGLMVNRNEKLVGSVPGIEVGDQFYFRMELCIIGMHGPIQGGIEYLTVKESEFNTPVATSIISSGGYDALDNGEVLVYTGQGGKSAIDGKCIEDQKLERGNLAMESSMKHQVPVRVTRGIKDMASPSGKTYTYDGLYCVEQCWSEKGKAGFEEFKFKLCRLPGQPDLGSATLKLSYSLKYKPGEREGLCLRDIANGKEGMPICVVNVVDDLERPPLFEYSTSLQYPQGVTYEQFGDTQGCDCTGVCKASDACACFLKNGNSFAYLKDGILVKERSIIYECGSNCRCSFSCRNRLTQKALKFRMEIFKTEDRGWGLRSWDSIPAGSFICELTGRVVQSIELPQSRDYVLDLGRVPKNIPLWGDVSSLLETQAAQATVSTPIPDLIIDSSQIGNASRFINHSCSPNVLLQCVLRDHQDTKRPHLMLFAMDNIPPFKELTRDYGSNLPSFSSGEPGAQCLCKSEDCRLQFCN